MVSAPFGPLSIPAKTEHIICRSAGLFLLARRYTLQQIADSDRAILRSLRLLSLIEKVLMVVFALMYTPSMN